MPISNDPSSAGPRASRLLVPVLALLGAACQTYDFEPVAPLSIRQTKTSENVAATPNKPNVMLLVDKSGSMDLPINPTLQGCRTQGANAATCGVDRPDGTKPNPCDVTKCPTRWSELSLALDSFLQSRATVGRYGLALFPEPEQVGGCGPTSKTASDVPPNASGDADTVLQAAADAARLALSKVKGENAPGPTGTGGGTPTSGSLAFMLNQQVLRDATREEIVILLTDGLPNCNGALASLAGTPACQCTLGPSPDDCPADTPPFAGAGCLNADETVNITNLLGDQGIQTFVVGFGADFGSSAARDTLQRLASAGALKHPRVCPGTLRNQACAADNPCDLATGTCSKQYYEATDATTLGAALEEISKTAENACVRPLRETPDDVALLSVTVNGKATLPGPTTWSYQPPVGAGPPAVVFAKGQELCNLLESSTGASPVTVDIRVLKVL